MPAVLNSPNLSELKSPLQKCHHNHTFVQTSHQTYLDTSILIYEDKENHSWYLFKYCYQGFEGLAEVWLFTWSPSVWKYSECQWTALQKFLRRTSCSANLILTSHIGHSSKLSLWRSRAATLSQSPICVKCWGWRIILQDEGSYLALLHSRI